VIEHALGITGADGPVERRLEVAAALVHAVIAAAKSDPAFLEEAGALLDELALPAAVFNPGGRAPWLANAAWRSWFGVHDSGRDRALLGAYIDEALRTGATLHAGELALALDGPPAYCAAILRPARAGTGATTGVIALCAPITDEVIARRLAVSAGALVWSGLGSGGADYWNRAWCAYTGHAREPRAPDAWQNAIDARDLPDCLRALGDAIDRRGAAEVEARVRRTDGADRWHRIRFSIAIPERRWFGAATDIAEARAEAERTELLAREQAARAAAEQAHRLKDRFVAEVSHDLRGPISTTLLWMRVLRDDTVPDAVRAQALEAIHQSALAQSDIIGELLDASRGVAAQRAPLPPACTRAPTLDGVRVLVVDDDPRGRDVLAVLFDRAGAEVDTAASAASARARVALRLPEILVCDIGMPGEDGYSFLRGLRASGQQMPAIALTVHALESDVKQSFSAGYDLHLAKPVDFEHLVENIQGLLARPPV
jgi:CheY-like chemotaxis protein